MCFAGEIARGNRRGSVGECTMERDTTAADPTGGWFIHRCRGVYRQSAWEWGKRTCRGGIAGVRFEGGKGQRARHAANHPVRCIKLLALYKLKELLFVEVFQCCPRWIQESKGLFQTTEFLCLKGKRDEYYVGEKETMDLYLRFPIPPCEAIPCKGLLGAASVPLVPCFRGSLPLTMRQMLRAIQTPEMVAA